MSREYYGRTHTGELIGPYDCLEDLEAELALGPPATLAQATRARRRAGKPRQSEALKRLLKIKFPTHVGTSPESLYFQTMGRYELDRVDVTLEHGGTVIHCNDPNGLKTAREYLKTIGG